MSPRQSGCTISVETAPLEIVADTLPLEIAELCYFSLSEIQSGNRLFRLREPIVVNLERHDELWVCEYEPLGLLGHGSSDGDALQALMDDFVVAYDGLVQEDDDRLTPGAQLLKEKLGEIVFASLSWGSM